MAFARAGNAATRLCQAKEPIHLDFTAEDYSSSSTVAGLSAYNVNKFSVQRRATIQRTELATLTILTFRFAILVSRSPAAPGVQPGHCRILGCNLYQTTVARTDRESKILRATSGHFKTDHPSQLPLCSARFGQTCLIKL